MLFCELIARITLMFYQDIYQGSVSKMLASYLRMDGPKIVNNINGYYVHLCRYTLIYRWKLTIWV